MKEPLAQVTPTTTAKTSSQSCALEPVSKSDPSLKYTYWKRDLPNGEALPPCLPQKVESVKEIPKPSVCSGMSVWNTLGTWEERNVSSRVETLLPSFLLERSSRIPETLDASLVSCVTFSDVRIDHCEASVCYIRGRPRFGFNITLCLDWSAPHAVGFFNVQELSDHSDPEIKLERRDDHHLDAPLTPNVDAFLKAIGSRQSRALIGSNLKVILKELGQQITSCLGHA